MAYANIMIDLKDCFKNVKCRFNLQKYKHFEYVLADEIMFWFMRLSIYGRTEATVL